MVGHVFLVIAGIGWFFTLLLLLQSWESLRFARSRCQAIVPEVNPWNKVGLLVPCKGHDLKLRENLRALFVQDHPNYELCFIIEDVRDPAAEVIRGLQREFSKVPSQLLVSGRASHTGQKIHNLLAGIDVFDSVQILAFVDSDAEPNPNWLRGLVHRIELGDCAVTGYRWLVPEKNSLANWLLYSVNSAAATLYGPGLHHLLWGGSWAIRRTEFENVGIAQAWENTLSDDLVASRAIHFAKLGVAFEPRCVTVSPIDATLGQAAEFLSRQLVVGRRYSPKQWWLSFVGLISTQAALWGGLAKSIGGLIVGDFSSAALWMAGTSVFWGLMVLRSYWRQQLAIVYVPKYERRLNAARNFDVWGSALVGAFLLFGFVSSWFTHQIVWRGNGYDIATSGRVQLIGRQSVSGQTSSVAIQLSFEPVIELEQRRAT